MAEKTITVDDFTGVEMSVGGWTLVRRYDGLSFDFATVSNLIAWLESDAFPLSVAQHDQGVAVRGGFEYAPHPDDGIPLFDDVLDGIFEGWGEEL